MHIFCTDRLRAVLNYGEVSSLGDCHDAVKIGGLAEEMDWHKALDLLAAAKCFFGGFRADVVRGRIDVHKHWSCAKTVDAASRCKERECRKNHFVARTNVKRLQCQQDGIGTIGATDRMFGVAIGGHFLLKLVNLGSADEVLAFHHREHSGLDLGTNSGVLGLQVKERDGDFTGGRGGHSEMIRSGAFQAAATTREGPQCLTALSFTQITLESCIQRPVLPNPPAPRDVPSSSSTTHTVARATGATTICAMRIPCSTVNGARPRFTSGTFISPR